MSESLLTDAVRQQASSTEQCAARRTAIDQASEPPASVLSSAHAATQVPAKTAESKRGRRCARNAAHGRTTMLGSLGINMRPLRLT
jgi:hypothetical protein